MRGVTYTPAILRYCVLKYNLPAALALWEGAPSVILDLAERSHFLVFSAQRKPSWAGAGASHSFSQTARESLPSLDATHFLAAFEHTNLAATGGLGEGGGGG